MSRSTSIWLVVNADAVPLAAFTVKHECQTWLSHFTGPARDGMSVYKMRDNPVGRISPDGRVHHDGAWVPVTSVVPELRQVDFS